MKHARIANKGLALILFLGVSLGCERNATQPLHPTSPPVLATGGDAEIAQLVERANKKGTQAEYDAITVAYKALSVDQLELFNQLKLASDKKRLEQKLAQSGARVNGQQSAMIAQALQQIGEFRRAINQQSIKRYGVPYNQLALSQVNTLLEEQTLNSPVMPNLEAPADASARLSQPMDCSSASFLLVARKVSNGTRGWSGWTQRRTPNTSDCDYEYRYSDYRINFDPKDWFADRLCDSFNNAIARRYYSGYTRLLFGNRGVWLWIGYPGLLSVDMANY